MFSRISARPCSGFARIHATMSCMRAPPGGRMPRSRSTPPDRDIFAAVLIVIAEPHDSAVGQLEAARALDLKEEQVDRVGGPGKLEPAAGERSVLDLGTGVIEHALAGSRVDPPAPRPAIRAGAADEVRRRAIDGDLVSGQADSRSGQSRARNSRSQRPGPCRPAPSRSGDRRTREHRPGTALPPRRKPRSSRRAG